MPSTCSSHDGRGIELRDLQLLGLPGVTGKLDDAVATGRFGIGLTTVRALSTSWEVHCGDYHVRFADLDIQPITPIEPDDQIAGSGWRVFRISLPTDVATAQELSDWAAAWSDAALLPSGLRC